MKRFLSTILLGICLTGCQLVSEQPAQVPTQPPVTTEAVTEPAQTTQPPTEHVHSYTDAVTPPNCVEEGYTTHTCACGNSYRDQQTEALGHEETTQVFEATDEAAGYTLHTCSRCGNQYQDQYTYTALTPTDYFDDAAFVGDSITMGLRNYHMNRGYPLGDVTFLCQGSYSVDHAVNNTMFISYQGQDMTVQDAILACGAKKVFIQLGMNDIALHGVDKTLENWGTLVENIRAKNPDIIIYIQSGTPIFTAGQIGGLNNQRMDAYNERLQVFAQENGCFYVDIATDMKDAGNGLQERYASDNYVHLTYSACALWTKILKNYIGG